MAKKARSPRPGHAHEQHLVLVRQCDGCARWVILRGSLEHVGAYHDQWAARAAAKELLRAIEGRPDPDPLGIEITRQGRAVATGLPPVDPVKTPAAA